MKFNPTFRKRVEIGRVVYINEGPYKGKLAAIVDVIDTNRALIDGPCTNVPRQGFKYSEMFLTKYTIKINRSQKTKYVRLAWEAANVDQQFAESEWNRNLNKDVLRSKMTDFDRYKLGRAKQSRNKIIKDAYFRIKKQDRKERRQGIAKKPKAKGKSKSKKGAAKKTSVKKGVAKEDPVKEDKVKKVRAKKDKAQKEKAK
ncbi:uncharacterized protein RpL14 [Cherax quadricarinatus]|nr:uncharacterized protein LOC128700973 [Cherax quadricarinatus]